MPISGSIAGCRYTMDHNDDTQLRYSAGQVLAGKYRVEGIIGQGGMGVVLAAEHLTLSQKVAIKLLHEAGLGHTDVVGRFMREARAAVRLRSEHVARVLDVGTLEDGRPFIVMEHLEGVDLGEVIEKNHPLPIPTAVDYVLQACEAIAEAHAAGIVHRDLKPKNLFLTHAVHGKPLVKVLDFGISKVDPERAPQEMQLTKTTEVIGSPSYMSPEQLRSSRNVDGRTDIWALGVILYELLTGRLPFYAETVTELVVVVVTDREPPIQSIRPDIPDGLAAIVARCLEKHPDQRFQSVLELVQALEPYASGTTATATERVRAVAAMAGATQPVASPAFAMAHTTPIAPPAASSAPNIGSQRTSVAWGETQSQVGPTPAMPTTPRSSTGLVVGLALGGLVAVAGVAGTAAWFMRRPPAASPVAAGAPSAMPLPDGRKDLPPLPAAPSATVAAAPAPTPEPAPPTGALPEERKPAPTTTGAKATPPSKTARPKASPTAPKPDDLSNIGRR